MRRFDLVLWISLCAAAGFGIPSLASADAPPLIPLQGFLTDPEGTPIDRSVRLDLRLLTAPSAGEALFSETHANVTVADGYFTIYLGDEASLDLSRFRDHQEVWLEMLIDGSEIITPRTRLGSVPFAGFATFCGDAATVGGKTAAEISADAKRVQEFHVNPREAVTLSSANVLGDFPGLSVRFTVAETTPIMVSYLISTYTGATPSHLVTVLQIDGLDVGSTISGDTKYWGNTSSYMGTVRAGTHTVRVRYRTPAVSSWSSDDWTSRRLDVVVFGP
jgi:hypothetical protein